MTPGLVLVHGGGQGSWVWDDAIAALRLQGETRPVVALDAPGSGTKRDRDASGVAMRDVAIGMAAEIEAADLCDVVLVGHSLAGLVLPLIAEIVPARIGRLVYVSSVAPPTGRSVTEELDTNPLFAEPDRETRSRALFCNDMTAAESAAFLARLGRDRWPSAIAMSETAWRYDHLAAFPSSYVVCLRDAASTVERQERFAERLRCSRIDRVDSGHQAMITRPHALAEILRREAAA